MKPSSVHVPLQYSNSIIYEHKNIKLSPSMSSTTSNNAAATTTIAAIHPDIIKNHILTKLDGATLTSIRSTTAELLSLSSDETLWQNVCNATWPSTTDPLVRDAIATFPSGHRSFFSDCFPALHHHNFTRLSSDKNRILDTAEFISSVDIFYEEKLIYSKVFTTETLSCWFATSPFQFDLLEPKETVAIPSEFEFDETCLRVSWVLIDPVKKRALNVASREAVDMRKHWMRDEMQLRYATVVSDGCGGYMQCAVLVSCGGDMKLREVIMQVEDMEGKVQTGMDSSVILNEAMEGERRKSDGKFEKDIYEKLLLKVEIEDDYYDKEKSQGLKDMLCIAIVVSFFVATRLFFF